MKITNNFVLFWGGIYSQWHKAPMTIDGIEYNCCEQYMMHQKALLFGDHNVAEMVLNEQDPRKHKELGRLVKNYNDKVWEKNRLAIVYEGNLAKFTQNINLQQQLVNTGDRIIVEASPNDHIWGIFMGEEDSDAENPAMWLGNNLLGTAIMLVRHKIVKNW